MLASKKTFELNKHARELETLRHTPIPPAQDMVEYEKACINASISTSVLAVVCLGTSGYK